MRKEKVPKDQKLEEDSKTVTFDDEVKLIAFTNQQLDSDIEGEDGEDEVSERSLEDEQTEAEFRAILDADKATEIRNGRMLDAKKYAQLHYEDPRIIKLKNTDVSILGLDVIRHFISYNSKSSFSPFRMLRKCINWRMK